MVSLGWTGVVSGALITGASIAGILSLPRRHELLVAVLALVGTTITLLSIGTLTAPSQHPATTVFAGAVALAASGGGFALGAALLTSLDTRCPSIIPLPESSGASTLILFLVDTEPPTYAPTDVTRRIDELTDAGLPEPSMAVLPFFYASHKSRYRAVGGRSPEQEQADSLADRIAVALDSSRFAGPVPVHCSDDELLAKTVAAAADRGFERVITVTPYVAEPHRIDRAKRGLDAARLDPGEIVVTHAASIGGSERIASRVAGRISELAGEPAATGVALVVHAQPGDRGRDYSDFESEENAFANRVRMIAAESGIAEESVRLCWDGWREPDITDTVRHLAVLGADRILVVPATFPFENLDTLLEIPAAIKQARAAEEVHVVQVSTWRDDPAVVEEIVCAIENAAQEL